MAATSMTKPLDYLTNLSDRDWLIGGNSRQFQEIVAQLYLQLSQLSNAGKPPKIILAEREPTLFLAKFIAACAAGCPLFLCNPDWGKEEWEQVFNLVQPDIVWGIANPQNPKPNRESPVTHRIMIPTGGSSGQIKFTIHTWETLMASVQGFTEYFQLNQVNSFCVLPLYHVSGLMQFMRSFTTGGTLAIFPFKIVEAGEISNFEPTDFFISLVPTQLQRLLQNAELTKWLAQFQTVLLGGAPAGNDLLEKARFHHIPLAPTYGMTETASQIATLKPADFLNAKISSGQILPHAQITIRNQQGGILDKNQIGNIIIESKSLALGYYPKTWENQADFQVDDLGFLDEQGHLNIVGRSSNKIITGGENVYPAEIEQAIRATKMVADICIIGIPDQQWGEALTAIYVPQNSNTSDLEIQNLLKDKLSKFKIPKHWIPRESLPYNAQGKINRQKLQQIALEFLQNQQSQIQPPVL